MIKAIVFDYDGVIVDSFSNVFKVYQMICQQFNVTCPSDIESFRKIYGYNYMECLANLGINEKDFNLAIIIYNSEIVKMDSRIFPGIKEVIKTLSKKYKLFLISASTSQEVRSKLERFGLIDFFTTIYCGGDEMIRKSYLFSELIKNNNYKSDELIAVGDRAADYKAANEAGIPDKNIISVTYGWGLDTDKIGDSKIVKEPKQILNFI